VNWRRRGPGCAAVFFYYFPGSFSNLCGVISSVISTHCAVTSRTPRIHESFSSAHSRRFLTMPALRNVAIDATCKAFSVAAFLDGELSLKIILPNSLACAAQAACAARSHFLCAALTAS
jgi:hypothetical protein